MQEEKKSRESKQENKFRKSNNRFKKLKLKKGEKKEKGNPPRTAKANAKAEAYHNNKKCDWGKKKLKSLIS